MGGMCSFMLPIRWNRTCSLIWQNVGKIYQKIKIIIVPIWFMQNLVEIYEISDHRVNCFIF